MRKLLVLLVAPLVAGQTVESESSIESGNIVIVDEATGTETVPVSLPADEIAETASELTLLGEMNTSVLSEVISTTTETTSSDPIIQPADGLS